MITGKIRLFLWVMFAIALLAGLLVGSVTTWLIMARQLGCS